MSQTQRKTYQPTPEDLAKAEQRRLKKEQAKKNPPPVKTEDDRGQILAREWLSVRPIRNDDKTVRVMTWNILAQTLVRRELFPTSDCLKASQREHMLYREIQSHNAAICCLQEVDRTEKLFPELEKRGYAWVYAKGPGKKHGCLIAYRKDMFRCIRENVITYGDQFIRQEAQGTPSNDSERRCKGASFRTKNIASMVALRRIVDGREVSDGAVVATTHLFWHPAYTYERARQAGILFREVRKFRAESPETMCWPCIVAGDFNFQPDDAAYALLTGSPLQPTHRARLKASRVVHKSLDPSVPVSADAEEDEEGGENDPDRIIVNARAARLADGLLTDEELEALFAKPAQERVRSVYDEGMRSIPEEERRGLTFASRRGEEEVTTDEERSRKGAFEPSYTSYTHYWQSVLDYIFVLDPPGRQLSIAALAKPHRQETFGEGLPRTGVCGSDHVSLAADLYWEDQEVA